jgi:hypothetical protein
MVRYTILGRSGLTTTPRKHVTPSPSRPGPHYAAPAERFTPRPATTFYCGLALRSFDHRAVPPGRLQPECAAAPTTCLALKRGCD